MANAFQLNPKAEAVVASISYRTAGQRKHSSIRAVWMAAARQHLGGVAERRI